MPWQIRYLFKRFVADKTDGPSEQYVHPPRPYNPDFPVSRSMENGYFTTTNVTSSVPSPTHGEAAAQTVIKGKGDPGYACTTRKYAILFRMPAYVARSIQ